MFIWRTFKLRLAITFILNAVNPGSKCTKEVTPLEKITNSLAAAAMVGFYGAVRNRTEGSVAKFSLWFAGCYYFFSVRDSYVSL